MIRVLIVEDSKVIAEFLTYILGSAGLQVIGTARDGQEALEAVARERPDVVTMDVHMPRMDGLEATRQIMETHATPIVIVTGTDPNEVATTFRAMEAGALAVLRRPDGIGHPDHEATSQELVQTVRLMSEVKVVRRWPRARTKAVERPPEPLPVQLPSRLTVVGIGASTGGPPVLQTILSGLSADFPAPLLIVQHMASGFSAGFVEWLAQSSTIPVSLGAQGMKALPGHAYVAPDGFQMRVGRDLGIVLTSDAAENGVRPSVSYLFRSLAAVLGDEAVAGLLSGMGRDGADELKVLKDKGAITFAQDRESSVIHGMPGEAIRIGAARFVLPSERIAPTLMSIASIASRHRR
jgi:two-component system chemotaxis response regulator CheB